MTPLLHAHLKGTDPPETSVVRFLAFIWPTLAVLNRRIFAGLRLSVLPVLAAVGVIMLGRSWSFYLVGRNALGILAFLTVEGIALSLCFAWFAIRWHRCLLLQDPQTALGGEFPPRSLRRYSLRLFGLGAAMTAALIVMSLISGDGWHDGSLRAVVLQTLFSICVAWAFYRFSPLLVGVPLGDPPSRVQAWRQTRKAKLPCLGLAVGTVAISLLLALPVLPDHTPITALEPVYIITSIWVQMLVVATALSVVHQKTARRQ
ncbi:hypothetical protein [Sagittula sp. SSi028]|uniref:hypothetical protein n=1 Tax=Sagittula sp. SSi028 TaxID=3400636 RepID=UPI003AF9E4F6